MALALDIASWLLLLGGSAFMVIGSVGLIRMPDFYTRLHPAGLTDTMGAGLILLGLALQVEPGLVTIKLALVFLFLMFTSPTASHATARAALAVGLAPELADDDENEGP